MLRSYIVLHKLCAAIQTNTDYLANHMFPIYILTGYAYSVPGSLISGGVLSLV